jgi:hypothetical protein
MDCSSSISVGHGCCWSQLQGPHCCVVMLDGSMTPRAWRCTVTASASRNKQAQGMGCQPMPIDRPWLHAQLLTATLATSVRGCATPPTHPPQAFALAFLLGLVYWNTGALLH